MLDRNRAHCATELDRWIERRPPVGLLRWVTKSMKVEFARSAYVGMLDNLQGYATTILSRSNFATKRRIDGRIVCG
jgi:hypothetical protein